MGDNHHHHNHSHDGHDHNHDHSDQTTISAEQRDRDRKAVPPGAIESDFKVIGMDCADEIAAIDNSLKNPEIYLVEANLMASTVKVYHSTKIDKNVIEKQIDKSGVKVVREVEKSNALPTKRFAYVALSGGLFAVAFVLQWLKAIPEVATTLLFFVSICFGGILVVPKAFRALRKLRLDMNVLVVVAAAGAIYLHDYAEATAVIFLFALSELLEAYSVVRARKAISEVLKIAPQNALIKGADGQLMEVPVSQLKLEDVVTVRAGDLIPIDGLILSGESDVNQASLTGESVAVKRKTGDTVYAGTINISAVLEIKVGQLFKDSKVSQIIKMVEDAQKSKAPLQTFVDQFARIYTPAIFILALGIMFIPPLFMNGDWNEWIYKSLVLLVIACPCALVISTPVSIASALTAMARKGVLVKGGKYLEGLGKLRALAVDKTGTITEGIPQVVSVKLWSSSASEDEVLRIAASIEGTSNHPLAQAITNYAKNKNIATDTATDIQSVHGRGIFAKIKGHEYFLGNHKFTHELNVCSSELEAYLVSVEENSLSIVVVGHKPHADCDGEVLGVIGIGDKVRENAAASIKRLHDLKCEAIVMLSGDNSRTASAIGKSVGIDESYGDLLPEDKVQKLRELVSKYKYVGMIGDGVNDAPALATATVGIAMGMVGTDAAIETADVTLVKDDLSQLAVAIEQGRRALGIIRFNIGFALLLKVIFLLLALLGYSSMWMAVAADTGATLLVILNALRLLKSQ